MVAQGLKYALVALAIFVPAALMFKLDLPVMATLTAGLLAWVSASGFWLLAFICAWETFRRTRSPKLLAASILVIGLPQPSPF